MSVMRPTIRQRAVPRTSMVFYFAAVLHSLFLLVGCTPDPAGPVGEPVSVSFLQSDGAQTFERVRRGTELRFPYDHGPHPDQQVEWWYFTGNLSSESGREFGFELTFFRIGLDRDPEPRSSRWSARDLYMAHFAVTDPESGFHSFEKLTRGALDLAGARAEPFRIWNEGWEVRGPSSATEDPFPMQLVAARDGIELELELESMKPRVLHGDRGFSQKGPDPRNASMYVSFTRIAAKGSISIAGREHEVSGTAWMDHEWSTSVLGESVEGWDWFSIQLEDGREIMLFELRETDLSKASYGSGSIIDASGRVTNIARPDFEILPLGTWTSPRTGITYPSGWNVQIAEPRMQFTVRPISDDQELDIGSVYWEGAVRVSGTDVGVGYVELVGYSR